jgi:hypothetical protein
VLALAFTLLTCFGIDASNPLLPGVVRFDDRESVYALRVDRPRLVSPDAGALASPPPRRTDAAPVAAVARRPAPRRAALTRIEVRPARPGTRGSPARDEDG